MPSTDDAKCGLSISGREIERGSLNLRNSSVVPGSACGMYLVVSNIETARSELIHRGIDVTEVFHRLGPGRRSVRERNPERRSYASDAALNDPEGNCWLLQELPRGLQDRIMRVTRSWPNWRTSRARFDAHQSPMANMRSE